MYYKVLKDNKVIDVLDHLTYLKWQPKNKIMLLCGEGEAQAILSSDGNTVWHVDGLYDLPVDGYDVVSVVEIDQYEFEQLKILNGKTPEQIADELILDLINSGII